MNLIQEIFIFIDILSSLWFIDHIFFKPKRECRRRAGAYLSRGHTKGQLGQHAAAIADYDIAIRINPDYVNAYYNRGNAKRRLGQYAAAKQDFRTALRLAIKAADTNLKTMVEEALRIFNE